MDALLHAPALALLISAALVAKPVSHEAVGMDE